MHVGNGIRDAWHGVQFYDDDSQLCGSVGEYLAAGLRAGETLLVVATEPHARGIRARLERCGHDVEDAKANGRLVMLDARDTLARFLHDTQLDERSFRAALAPVLARANERGARIRIYGEMVDLLWKDGNPDSALRLEALWNELHAPESFWLLCGYQRPSNHGSPGARDICAVHTHVIDLRTLEAARAV